MADSIGDTGKTDTGSMSDVGKELKALSLELAKEKVKLKKMTEPAKAANQAASGGV